MPKLITANNWLSPVNRTPSYNLSARNYAQSTKNKQPIDMLVIHNISLPPNEFGGQYIQQFFCNKLNHRLHNYFATIDGLQVSSHLLIERTGCVYQFVPFHLAAWHAGVSNFLGDKNCNNNSIGIELEGTDDVDFTCEQYSQLTVICKLLMQTYNIAPERIMGHSDISPGRKTDPGSKFNWRRLLAAINK